MSVRCITSIVRRGSAIGALAIAVMFATTAHATLIFQSNLSSITTPTGDSTGNNFQLGYMSGAVTGITNTFYTGTTWGFNFVYSSPSQANLVGAYNQGGSTNIKLDGAVLADSADTQDGGYFLALDSVYEASPIHINIATVLGDTYTVTFDYAGTQQPGYTGTTTDALTVALGADTPDTTPSLTVTQQSFTGWDAESYTFTAATTGTEVLSFLASGTPTGAGQEPAMTLLDNIDVSQNTPSPTPEPDSLILLATGLVGLGGFLRWRSKKSEGASF
jgi:hypothetical protein